MTESDVRRRKNASGGRHISHRVKMTVEEEKALQRKANEMGVTPARLLAEAALGKNTHVQMKVVANELFAIRRALQTCNGLPDGKLTERISNVLKSFE